MRKFNVGDRARIGSRPNCQLNFPQFEGYITTICGLSHVKDDKLFYTVLMPPGAPQAACENILHPIDDGNAASTWSALADIWQPKVKVER